MTERSANDLTDLAERLARLEAAESVRRLLGRYSLHLDAGEVDELVALFTEDAELSIEYPRGTDNPVRRRGRDELRQQFEPLPFGNFRHHNTTAEIDVSPDGTAALLTNRFISIKRDGSLDPGNYEMSMCLETDGVWRIARLVVYP